MRKGKIEGPTVSVERPMSLGYIDRCFQPFAFPYLHEALLVGRICFAQDGGELR